MKWQWCLFDIITPFLTCQIISPNSLIAGSKKPIEQYFSCGRTKTAAIVNCIGDFFSELLEDMKSYIFSLMLDGRNDNGLEKIYHKIFDINFSRVMTTFADINLINGTNASTAASIFESVDTFISTNNISWDHCLGLGLDNTNANIGNHNSIKTRARGKSQYCYCWIPLSYSSQCLWEWCYCICTFVLVLTWFKISNKRKNVLNE